MKVNEMIDVLQAYRDGGKIQSRLKHPRKDDWKDTPNPLWDFPWQDYRVKPEPKTIYVNEYKEDTVPYGTTFFTKADAIRHAECFKAVRVAVKYIEVAD